MSGPSAIPPSDGGGTLLPVAGTIVFAVVWGIFTVFFLYHFISESMS